MNKEDALLLIQLINAMKEATAKLELAYEKRDAERVELAKRMLLDLQAKIGRILL